MKSRPVILVRRWQVGHRTVAMAVPELNRGAPTNVTWAWYPDTPGLLTDDEYEQFLDGRSAALRDLANLLGIVSCEIGR